MSELIIFIVRRITIPIIHLFDHLYVSIDVSSQLSIFQFGHLRFANVEIVLFTNCFKLFKGSLFCGLQVVFKQKLVHPSNVASCICCRFLRACYGTDT